MQKILIKMGIKKSSRGVRGHAPAENFHTVVAILALFEQFLGKFCLNCLPLNLSVSPNMMAFCLYIFDYVCLERKAYCYQKGLKL